MLIARNGSPFLLAKDSIATIVVELSGHAELKLSLGMGK